MKRDVRHRKSNLRSKHTYVVQKLLQSAASFCKVYLVEDKMGELLEEGRMGRVIDGSMHEIFRIGFEHF